MPEQPPLEVAAEGAVQPPPSKIHKTVLMGLKELVLHDYELLIEEKGGRLDLPNELFHLNKKPVGQRKKSLCFTDTVVHRGRTPRVLVEIVDSSPGDPNGISGLVVNADRVALTVAENLDLLFVVLGEMKEFYCSICSGGHRLADIAGSRIQCVTTALQQAAADPSKLLSMLHEGVPMNFRKALIDYPINPYLTRISPPSVVFLNSTRIETDWDAYKSVALALVREALENQLASPNTPRTTPVELSHIEELFPPDLRSEWDQIVEARPAVNG